MSLSRHTQGMLPAGTFADRTIVITGGGTGLGRSLWVAERGGRLAPLGPGVADPREILDEGG